MKSTKKIIIIFTILAVCLPVLSSINSSISSTTFKSRTNFERQVQENLKRAGYWNLTGTPISIDDTNPTKNWSYTANTYDWCSGSGTWNDPYLIENVTIDGQGSGSCIEIRSSTKYFIIRNCTLSNSGLDLDYDGGIRLDWVDNGKLIGNNCSNNNANGIILDRSSHNNISGNIANNNIENGIRLEEGSRNIISGCVTKYNHIGINIFSENDNVISDNVASNNFDDGLNLDISSNNNISRNRACNNTDSGIYISGGTRNKIMGNFIDDNNDFGIHIYDSPSCTVSGNNITNNNYGIYLEGYGAHEISENNASHNKRGLYSLKSNGNNINNNTVHNNEYGIYLENSNTTFIVDNNITYNIIGLRLYQSNDNYISNNDLCGNPIAVQEEENCEGNEFENNECWDIPPPPENGFPLEIVIIIVICMAGAMFAVGMFIFRKKSSREELISESILSSQELEELRKTEAEVSVEKEHHVCVVHRGKIVGAMYSCPNCETYYCMKCATVLKKKGETCWACNNEIEL